MACSRPLTEKEGGHLKGPAVPSCGMPVGAGASPDGLENDMGQSTGLSEKTGGGITAAQASWAAPIEKAITVKKQVLTIWLRFDCETELCN